MQALLAIPIDHAVSFPFVSRRTTLILVVFILAITYSSAFAIKPLLQRIRKDEPSVSALDKDSTSAKASATPSASTSTPAPALPPSPAPASPPLPLHTIHGQPNLFSKIWASGRASLTRNKIKDLLPTTREKSSV